MAAGREKENERKGREREKTAQAGGASWLAVWARKKEKQETKWKREREKEGRNLKGATVNVLSRRAFCVWKTQLSRRRPAFKTFLFETRSPLSRAPWFSLSASGYPQARRARAQRCNGGVYL